MGGGQKQRNKVGSAPDFLQGVSRKHYSPKTMTTKSGIYAITNTKNGKVYIGSTIDFKRRWGEHRRDLCKCVHDNSHLQRSWNKYGEDTFEFGVLEYLDNFEELTKAEQFWMDIYREEGKELYNTDECADCPARGRKLSKEVRRNMSRAQKLRFCNAPVSEETRRKLSKANTGRKLPPRSKEHCHKLSKANMGNQHTLGYKHGPRGPTSKETRQKISVANGKSYPAFIHKETGKIIPAGVNLASLCRKLDIPYNGMNMVKHGKCFSHYGWTLVNE